MWVAHYAAAAVGHVAPVEHRPVGCNAATAPTPMGHALHCWKSPSAMFSALFPSLRFTRHDSPPLPTTSACLPTPSFGLQVEKAEKREETVAVAVVQLVPPGTSVSGAVGLAASRFLLVQRPPSGLLAGLWQFPLLQLPEGAEEEPARQQQMMSEYLEAQLGLRLVQQQGAAGWGRRLLAGW